jgi:hypothetical protein
MINPTTTPAKPRPKPKRRKPSTAETCSTCGGELCVFWKCRAWCVSCDARLLFGTIDAEGDQ